jgi:hypothetical protein
MNLESRYSPPTLDCAHPEWWHSTDCDSTEFEVSELVAGFVRALQPEIVVETGTAWGQTAQVIGRALERNRHGHLYTLEPDPKRAEFSRDRCAGLPVTVVDAESLSWEPPGPVGVAWFDSLIELRVPEFRYFYPWLVQGAVVGFHDTADRFKYWPQIEALATEGLLNPIRLRTPRGVTFAEVL